MNQVQTMCIRCFERMEVLKMPKTGQRAENAALEFCVGWSAALEANNHAESNHVKTVIATIICVQGLFGIRRIVLQATMPAPAIAVPA